MKNNSFDLDLLTDETGYVAEEAKTILRSEIEEILLFMVVRYLRTGAAPAKLRGPIAGECRRVIANTWTANDIPRYLINQVVRNLSDRLLANLQGLSSSPAALQDTVVF